MSNWLSDPDAPALADLAECRVMLRGGSRSFFAASLLLPAAVRDPATALYAFCRIADDEIDLSGGRHEAVERMRDRLDRIYRGAPLQIAADRAFAAVVAEHYLPRPLPDALIEGFAWDAEGRRYRTIEDLHGYGARVAGTVGAMMALLMGVRNPALIATACDLGIAMQLSNIARDVGEDARAGRLYLPLDWLAEVGLEPEQFLAEPVFTPALGQVVQRLLEHADALYLRADAGIAALPPSCRAGIKAARLLYAEIGHEVARRGYDSVASRATVPAHRKARLLARSRIGRNKADAVPLPALDAAQFLVDAVASAPDHPLPPADRPWWKVDDQLIWVLELFDRLEKEERGGGRSVFSAAPGEPSTADTPAPKAL